MLLILASVFYYRLLLLSRWAQAQHVVADIINSNRRGLFVATLPYKIGIFTSVTAAIVSIPMIFDLNTVLWFNEVYVTSGSHVTSCVFVIFSCAKFTILLFFVFCFLLLSVLCSLLLLPLTLLFFLLVFPPFFLFYSLFIKIFFKWDIRCA